MGLVDMMMILCIFFFQAEDGIRDLVRSRGLGDVYKRQTQPSCNRLRAQRAAGLQGREYGALDLGK